MRRFWVVFGGMVLVGAAPWLIAAQRSGSDLPATAGDLPAYLGDHGGSVLAPVPPGDGFRATTVEVACTGDDGGCAAVFRFSREVAGRQDIFRVCLIDPSRPDNRACRGDAVRRLGDVEVVDVQRDTKIADDQGRIAEVTDDWSSYASLPVSRW